MGHKSRHTGNVDIVALGTALSDATANGTIVLRHNVIIPGDLTVQGETTSVETNNTVISDRVITLNKGELGPGVTGADPVSGFEVDRGTGQDKVSLLWNEDTETFELVYSSGAGAELSMGTAKITNLGYPVAATDAATKSYVDDQVSAISTNQISQDDTSVTVSDPGTPGVIDIVVDGVSTAQINSGGIELKNGATEITTAGSDNLVLSAGSNLIELSASSRLNYQSAVPAVDAAGVNLYAASASTGTQLFYSNSAESGEILSKRRAILYGLIF
jgi:hypothetical protein